jgi:hypothetical protein
MEDLEDLFTEDDTFHTDVSSSKNDHPMIIPEFDPCSGGGTNGDVNEDDDALANNNSNTG